MNEVESVPVNEVPFVSIDIKIGVDIVCGEIQFETGKAALAITL